MWSEDDAAAHSVFKAHTAGPWRGSMPTNLTVTNATCLSLSIVTMQPNHSAPLHFSAMAAVLLNNLQCNTHPALMQASWHRFLHLRSYTPAT